MEQRSAEAEERRQQILQHYEILDTPPEETFDRIVSIITAVFGTSIAAITLCPSGDERNLTVPSSIPFAIIIGSDELKSGLYSLKDLRRGEQRRLGVDGIVAHLSQEII